MPNFNEIDVYYIEGNIEPQHNKYNERNERNYETLDMSSLDLAQRDNSLRNIEAQIESKRSMLLEKQKILRESSKENEFLVTVKNDYQKYYDYIIGQKKDQIKAMDLLQKYVDDLMVTGKLAETDIQKARHDQKSLGHEMSVIKKELDNITGGQL